MGQIRLGAIIESLKMRAMQTVFPQHVTVFAASLRRERWLLARMVPSQWDTPVGHHGAEFSTQARTDRGLSGSTERLPLGLHRACVPRERTHRDEVVLIKTRKNPVTDLDDANG